MRLLALVVFSACECCRSSQGGLCLAPAEWRVGSTLRLRYSRCLILDSTGAKTDHTPSDYFPVASRSISRTCICVLFVKNFTSRIPIPIASALNIKRFFSFFFFFFSGRERSGRLAGQDRGWTGATDGAAPAEAKGWNWGRGGAAGAPATSLDERHLMFARTGQPGRALWLGSKEDRVN